MGGPEILSAAEYRRQLTSPGSADKPRAGNTALRALGRLPKGTKNKTEQRYEDEVILPAAQAGEIVWHHFEGITLRLAPNTSYTADFAVMLASGLVELHEVKGSDAVYTDDARAKTKIAAAMFPFPIRICIPKPKRDGAGWSIEEVGRA